jgi:energy-coupling factor transporter ATP-binding protein EcfA2
MRLKGKNFQPWAEFDLEIDGLTVLVGPSNKGKSSLFRALKGILRNDIPEGFIRNNQEEPLEIELEVDGHNIKVTRKRGGSTKYVLDGKTYTSLGGKVPDEIEKLKYGEMKIGDYRVDPIFAKQNKAQFLIDDDQWKPQELNAILGAFSSTEKLDAGKKEANLRITQRKSEANTLASEIRSAEERSASLLDITGKATVIADAILALERGIRDDETTVGQLDAVLYHQARLQPLQEILDTLVLPDLTEAGTLLQVVEGLEAAGQALMASRFLRRVEAALDSVSAAWDDLMVPYKQNKNVGELLVLLDKARVYRTEYSDRLTSIIEQAETQLTEVKVLNSSIAYLAVAATARQAHENLTSQLTELASQLEVAEAELETVRQEFAANEAKKIKSGACPKCGKSMEHVCQ